MTYEQALEISRYERKGVRHPDMAKGHSIRNMLMPDPRTFALSHTAVRIHPSGKKTGFRPGLLEAERQDWYVV